ncbi:DUF3772 domain-containing protein [Neomegalonema sp.]|uniref:DUF3772 domain-containing protein n=1 Tax=Neomegalonema sp. TaxID=2039713 RepID=UPI002630FCFB|nr:DUF3772 domain-containing protein [Neomegalonema sp.]MDD2870177.1 DUF3772 domain-containing protein [Neomegalonema sp.]
MRGLIFRLCLALALVLTLVPAPVFRGGPTAHAQEAAPPPAAPAAAAPASGVPASGAMMGPPLPDPPETRLRLWENADAVLRQRIDREGVSAELAPGWRQTLDQQRAEARNIADRARAALAPLQAQLEALGPPPDETSGQRESATIFARRLELRNQATPQEAVMRRAELAVTRADSLITLIAERQREEFTARILERGPSPLNPMIWITGGREIVSRLHRHGADVMAEALSPASRWKVVEAAPALLAGLLGALLFGVAIKRRVIRRLHALIAQRDRTRLTRLGLGLAAAAVRLTAPVFAALVVYTALISSGILGAGGVGILTSVVAAVVVLAAAHALAKVVFSPNNASARLLDMTDASARAATQAGVGLGLATALDHVAMGLGEPSGWGREAQSLLQFGFVFLTAAFFARLAHSTAPPPREPAASVDPNAPPVEPGSEEDEARQAASGFGLRDALRIACYAIAIAAPVLALSGFYVLAIYALTRMAASAALIAMGALIYQIALEAAARLAASGSSGGSAAEERAPWWASLLVGLTMATAGGGLLALIWGASLQDLWDGAKRLREGFSVGETRISLGDLLWGVLVFALILGISRFIQRQLRNRILVRAKVDPGLRDSVTAGVGYLGVLIALLVAVGAAGLDLSKLAIVAGALSVGVGFGLQNVVNNFVSGIILLIERPVRAGDVVEVENRLGAVKRINVRSTEIELFDRTILIVPNSTLISNSVLNWTRQNTILRLSIPVGVVAGSDTERVRDVLLSAARSHARVMRYPAPMAIFMGFGPLSLDFELRVFLYHIDDMMNVRSDLCFAIDKRFRELGIQLPSGREERKMVQMDSLVRGVEAMGRPAAPVAAPPAAEPAAASAS